MANEKQTTETGKQTDTADTPGGQTNTEGKPGEGKATPGEESGEKPTGESPNDQKKTGDTDEAKFSQSQVNSIVKKASEEAVEKALKKAEETRAEKDAEEKGEFKALAETRKQRVETLEAQLTTLQTQNDGLVSAFTSLVLSELKAMPAEVRAAAVIDVPEKDEEIDALEVAPDALAALARWIPKGKALALKLSEEVSQPGYTGGPRTKKDKEPHDKNKKPDESIRDKQKRSGRYSL